MSEFQVMWLAVFQTRLVFFLLGEVWPCSGFGKKEKKKAAFVMFSLRTHMHTHAHAERGVSVLVKDL